MDFSIITINYNNAEGLKKTIESVVEQTFKGFEYIIIDGGSTDKSVDIIKENSDKITHWISEKDGGIYNAMNKGILASKGKYCLFLNSGDYLIGNNILDEFHSKADFSKSIIYGDIVFEVDATNKRLRSFPDTLTFKHFFNDHLPHSSTLIQRDLFETVGMYNETYKIISDWEFFIKAIILHRASYFHVPVPIAVFNLEGVSAKNIAVRDKEKNDVLQRDFFLFHEDYKAADKNSRELNAIRNHPFVKWAKSFKKRMGK